MSTRTETPAQLVGRAAELTTQAARGQYAATPDHRDLYSLLLATERALDALSAVNSSVGVQTARYAEGRQLRTDTGRGPAEVLAAAVDHGRALAAALRQARQAARSMAGEFARLAQPGPGDGLAGEDPGAWDADVARRCRWAAAHNDRHPSGAWSTGEHLAVALVLGDTDHLAAMGYTPQQAERRVAGGMADPPADFTAWLQRIRSQVDDR